MIQQICQFDLWFLYLFQIQLVHLNIHGSHTVEAWLREFWALLCYQVRWVQLWWDSSWATSNPKRWCCESATLNIPANLENSAVVTGLEKVSYHSNPKKRQCQSMLKLPQRVGHDWATELNLNILWHFLTPWVPTWSLGLGAPTGNFCPGSPNVGQPSNCWKRPPVAVCFLLPELALLPTPALVTPGAGPPHLAKGPWDGPGDPCMALGPLRCTPTATSPMGRTALT